MRLNQVLIYSESAMSLPILNNIYKDLASKYDSLESVYPDESLRSDYTKLCGSFEMLLHRLTEFFQYLESDTIPTDRDLRWAQEKLTGLIKEYAELRTNILLSDNHNFIE